MTLSSLIVSREVATMRQVEEALARQVIYGGDLATNLLEVADVDEQALTTLIADAVSLPPAPAGELPVAATVADLVPAEMAVEQGFVPLTLDGEILVLAVIDRLAADTEERLMFSLGFAIDQRVATAVRVRQAITRLYGRPLDRRMERLVLRLSGAAGEAPLVLGDETAVARGAKADGDARDAHSHSTPPARQRPAHLAPRSASSRAPAGRRRRGPITLDDAKREAAEASDRDALLDLFFEFSRQFFDYTALFLLHGDIAEGRDAFGPGASRERVLGIGVPLDLPSLLSRVRDERTPITSNVPRDGLDEVLLADLGRPNDLEVAVVPLTVRTRAVAALLGDCGEGGIDATGLGQVTVFAAEVRKALERVILRRKLTSSRAGALASAPPAMPAAGPAAEPRPSAAPEAPRAQAVARLIPASTMPPPPPNVVTVRNISGPPIPREDPDDGRAAAPVRRPGDGLDSQALFDILGWETGTEESEPPPASSAVAVPPHRPPPGHSSAPEVELPSVIVDLDRELGELVERVIGGDGDESAEGELLRQGERAMPVIMDRFPGPVTLDRARIASSPNPPRASECGPLLRLVARERKVALPFVIARLSDPDPEVRCWATYLLCDLPYADAIPHALARLGDTDPTTRAAALHAMASVAKAFPDPAREAVRTLAASPAPTDRVAAVRAMAQLRQSALVPDLLRSLADGDEHVTAAALDALVQLTRQDFGSDARPWIAWWDENASRHRVEWLIDALTHEVVEIRRAAGEELRAVTREYFGYASDLPARDRDRAQQRYRDWWVTEGRARFKKR